MKDKKKIKIVHICTYIKGGAGTAAFRIHEALLNNGLDTNLLCLDYVNEDKNIFKIAPIEPPSKNLITRVIQKLNRIFFVKYNPSIVFKKEFQSINHLLRCEASAIPYTEYNLLNNPLVKSSDIIHLHWVSGLLDYPSFFSNVNKPIIWTFHDMNPFLGIFHYKEDEVRNYKVTEEINNKAYKIKIKSIQSCKVPIEIVCPSEWLTSEAKSSKLCCSLEVNTIPYPIDFDTFKNRDKKLIREQFRITENEIVFLFACQTINVFRKGFDILLEALKKITNKDITVFVVGEQNDLNIENLKIRFTGTIRDNHLLSDYYSLADVFIIPSREDNLPNVMLESLSCGTPVIGFPVGGIKEHVIPGLTGVLAKDISNEALVDALEEFILNKDKFDADKIRNYALSKFNSTLITASYSNIYYSLFCSHRKKFLNRKDSN